MNTVDDSSDVARSEPSLARRLGLFDATMLVMGGIIGSGIFMNPSVAARHVHSEFWILAVWALGGLVALAAGFIWAELATVRPQVGGQYAYLREAFHPLVAFLYGWGLLLVIQTGGMAAVAVTFARYFLDLTGLGLAEGLVAALALGALTIVNCLGVRAGGTLQSVLMVIKILAIVALVLCGLFLAAPSRFGFPPPTAAIGTSQSYTPVVTGFAFITSIGAAMVPVLFAYGGWQTATFVAGEIREPGRNLPRALVIGVAAVVVLYLAVNFVCVRVLGVHGLAATSTPASDVMRIALGPTGAKLIAAGIAISTLGFLSQSMLTAPRVYFAMAKDGLFFRDVARVSKNTRVPIFAIVLQGVLAAIIALSGKYEQILNYVVSVDFIFFGLTALCVFIFRQRFKRHRGNLNDDQSLRSTSDVRITGPLARVPGHPLTTFVFIAVCWLVVINTVYQYPRNTLIGIAILLAGIPAYFFWQRGNRA